VSWKDEASPAVLSNVSLTVSMTSRIAIVGPNGQGARSSHPSTGRSVMHNSLSLREDHSPARPPR
jgi:ABC-type branched-subunit amino acid transport system ATPase component